MKTIKHIKALAGVTLLCASMQAGAVPITGDIGMGGNFAAVDSNWNATSLDTATGIDFDPNLFIVNSTTGSFTSVSTTIGAISDFQFGTGNGSYLADRTGNVGPINDFWSIDGFSFRLTSVVKLSSSSATFLDLAGTGQISAAGYDTTDGVWNFTGDTTGGTFTWSAGSADVPEPAMLALLSMGLIGFGLVGRRKK